MEDLAASLVSHSHSAPLYLLYDVASLTKQRVMVAPPPSLAHDDDGFEFATAAAKNRAGGDAAALRACASDVSADELFRAGVLLPLRLPPRLQRTAAPHSAGASAATSPTASAAGCRTAKHRGFDPFAAALEKVRKDAAPRRSRSLSPLRQRGSGTATVSSAREEDSNNNSSAPRPAAVRKASAAGKGVKHMLCRAVVASAAAAAPRTLRMRRKGGVAYHRQGLLVCFGF